MSGVLRLASPCLPASPRRLRDADLAAILLKTSTAAELRAGFAAVVAGRRYFAAELEAIVGGAGSRRLTARELQVLSLVVQGRSNAEIASLLNISPKTAEHHRTNMMRKLGVHSAAELAAFALREGLLDVNVS